MLDAGGHRFLPQEAKRPLGEVVEAEPRTEGAVLTNAAPVSSGQPQACREYPTRSPAPSHDARYEIRFLAKPLSVR